MALAPPRRRRRRPWGLYLVLLTLALLSFIVVRSARSGDGPGRRLDQLSYLDQVRPLVTRSSAQGAELGQIRADGSRLGRSGITRGLDRIRRESDTIVADLRSADPPSSLSTAHSMLVTTMALRARAANNIGESVNQAFGPNPVAPLVDALVGAGLDLSASDRAYQVFVDSLPVEAKEAAMPPSKWVDDSSRWVREELAAFVASLRSSASPTPLHDLTLLTMGLKPAPVGSEGGAAVLALAKAMTLEVVVANVGNAEERDVPVVAAFVGPLGGGEPVREVVTLAPGQRRALQLKGLKQLGVGAATLRVMVGPVAGEGSVEDNQRLLPVLVRG